MIVLIRKTQITRWISLCERDEGSRSEVEELIKHTHMLFLLLTTSTPAQLTGEAQSCADRLNSAGYDSLEWKAIQCGGCYETLANAQAGPGLPDGYLECTCTYPDIPWPVTHECDYLVPAMSNLIQEVVRPKQGTARPFSLVATLGFIVLVAAAAGFRAATRNAPARDAPALV